MSFDDRYGEGALAEVSALLDFEDIPLASATEDGDVVVFVWDDAEKDPEALQPTCVIRTAEASWTFESLIVSRPEIGFFARLTGILPAWAQARGVERFIAEPVTPQARQAFLRGGFEAVDGTTIAGLERVKEYGNWKAGKSDEPDWHRSL